jgi:hypothetical protein
MNSKLCTIAAVASTLTLAAMLTGCVGTAHSQPSEAPAKAAALQQYPLASGFAVTNNVDCKPNCYH